MITYREATKEEIPYIAKLSAMSFKNYPFFDFVFQDAFKQPKEYLSYMEKLHCIHIRANMKKHKCFVGIQDGKIVSIALLQDSSKKRISILDYIMSGAISLVVPVGFRKILNFFDVSNKACKDCEKKYSTAWYLEMLAVDSSMKGRGLGSAMINDCLLPYIKKQGGIEFTLITNTEKNCMFYEKNGFKQFAKRTLEYKGKKINNWSFVKN